MVSGQSRVVGQPSLPKASVQLILKGLDRKFDIEIQRMTTPDKTADSRARGHQITVSLSALRRPKGTSA